MLSNFIKTSLIMLVLLMAESALANESSAKEVINSFYKSYLDSINSPSHEHNKPVLAYSQAFKNEIENNHALCEKHLDEVCGWAADGDEYLDAQDYDSALNYASSGFQITELNNQLIQVEFNLFPLEKDNTAYLRKLSFKMLKEHGHWVVDDILYEGRDSARQQIQEENQLID